MVCVCRNTISSRFTLCEWDKNNRVNYCVARTELDTSERMRTDAWRAVRMTEQRTRMRQNSNTRKLSRLRSTSSEHYIFWRWKVKAQSSRSKEAKIGKMPKMPQPVFLTLTDPRSGGFFWKLALWLDRSDKIGKMFCCWVVVYMCVQCLSTNV